MNYFSVPGFNNNVLNIVLNNGEVYISLQAQIDDLNSGLAAIEQALDYIINGPQE